MAGGSTIDTRQVIQEFLVDDQFFYFHIRTLKTCHSFWTPTGQKQLIRSCFYFYNWDSESNLAPLLVCSGFLTPCVGTPPLVLVSPVCQLSNPVSQHVYDSLPRVLTSPVQVLMLTPCVTPCVSSPRIFVIPGMCKLPSLTHVLAPQPRVFAPPPTPCVNLDSLPLCQLPNRMLSSHVLVPPPVCQLLHRVSVPSPHVQQLPTNCGNSPSPRVSFPKPVSQIPRLVCVSSPNPCVGQALVFRMSWREISEVLRLPVETF